MNPLPIYSATPKHTTLPYCLIIYIFLEKPDNSRQGIFTFAGFKVKGVVYLLRPYGLSTEVIFRVEGTTPPPIASLTYAPLLLSGFLFG